MKKLVKIIGLILFAGLLYMNFQYSDIVQNQKSSYTLYDLGVINQTAMAEECPDVCCECRGFIWKHCKAADQEVTFSCWTQDENCQSGESNC